MTELLVRYAHFISILVLFSTLVMQHLLIQAEMSIDEVKRFATIDVVAGLSAGCVLVAGLTLWFLVGKPAEFYSYNWVFHLKVSLFITIAILSIFPTRFFASAKKSDENIISIPKKILIIVRVILLILIVIPLLAVFMAKGYGLSI